MLKNVKVNIINLLNVKKCDIEITFKFVICNLNHEIDSFEMERVLINRKQNIDCQSKYNKFVERGRIKLIKIHMVSCNY